MVRVWNNNSGRSCYDMDSSTGLRDILKRNSVFSGGRGPLKQTSVRRSLSNSSSLVVEDQQKKVLSSWGPSQPRVKLTTQQLGPEGHSFAGAALTRRLKTCNSPEELKLIITESSIEFNCIHVSASFSRLVNIQRHHRQHPPRKIQRRTYPQSTTASFQEVGLMLLHISHPMIPSLSHRHASHMLWATATLHVDIPPDTIHALLQQVLAVHHDHPQYVGRTPFQNHMYHPGSPNGQDLANVIWACATLHHHPHKKLMNRFEQLSLSLLKEQMSWNAKAKNDMQQGWGLKVDRHKAVQRTSHLFNSQPPFQTTELANILHGLSKLKHVPSSEWLQAFIAATLPILQNMQHLFSTPQTDSVDGPTYNGAPNSQRVSSQNMGTEPVCSAFDASQTVVCTLPALSGTVPSSNYPSLHPPMKGKVLPLQVSSIFDHSSLCSLLWASARMRHLIHKSETRLRLKVCLPHHGAQLHGLADADPCDQLEGSVGIQGTRTTEGERVSSSVEGAQGHGEKHDRDPGTAGHGEEHEPDPGTAGHGEEHDRDPGTAGHGEEHERDPGIAGHGEEHDRDPGTAHHRHHHSSWPPSQWIQQALETVSHQLPILSQQHLGSVLWAVSRLATPLSPSKAALQHQLSSQASSALTPPSVTDHSPSSALNPPALTPPSTSVRPSPSWMDSFLAAATQSLHSRRSFPSMIEAKHFAPGSLLGSSPSHLAQGSSLDDTAISRRDDSLWPEGAVSGFPLQALCNMLQALAQLQYRPSSFWLEQQLRASLLPGDQLFSTDANLHQTVRLDDQSTVIGSHSGSQSMKSFSGMSPHIATSLSLQDSLTLLRSCAQLSHRPSRQVLVGLQSAVCYNMQHASMHQLTTVGSALARLGVVPTLPFLKGFWACTLPHLKRIPPHELIPLLIAATQMQETYQKHLDAKQHVSGGAQFQSEHLHEDVQVKTQAQRHEQSTLLRTSPTSKIQSIIPKGWAAEAVQAVWLLISTDFSSTRPGTSSSHYDDHNTKALNNARSHNRLDSSSSSSSLHAVSAVSTTSQGPASSAAATGNRLLREWTPNPNQLSHLLWVLTKAPALGSQARHLHGPLLAAAKKLLPTLLTSSSTEYLALLPLRLALAGAKRKDDRCNFLTVLRGAGRQSLLGFMNTQQVRWFLCGIWAMGYQPGGPWMSFIADVLQDRPEVIWEAAQTKPKELLGLLRAILYCAGSTPTPIGGPASPKGSTAVHSALIRRPKPTDLAPQLLLMRPMLVSVIMWSTLASMRSKNVTSSQAFMLVMTLHRLMGRGVIVSLNTKQPPTEAMRFPSLTHQTSFFSTSCWWDELYISLQPHLPSMGGSKLSRILYCLAQLAQQDALQQMRNRSSDLDDEVVLTERLANDSSFRHPPPYWMEEALSCVAGDFKNMTASDVARLLCALVKLRRDVTGNWMQRLMLLVETRSAIFSIADHKLIQKAWLQLGASQHSVEGGQRH
ncbi:hypothetical protein CEUSTIGMA_g5211.t1 [Chlamydomonas eustigma]|uniref:Uncharacterized protein n=1 Tax=Chlamydomonas eustigma TaxID=1157962 RepID=A0A250X3W0_9CHLO|nr:hypothetical protein CEUSTIGMA_g5211.t1 [Chlamydomonas eustigma]|eukprot:GAX77768.1 hypothetical protein CEUSTIGMA_g5211.t1 [Chlamydomonas eustigma]